jgi:hypothetical protein
MKSTLPQDRLIRVGSSAFVRAFRVEVKDWPEFTVIVRCSSPSRAKFLAWNSAKEADYSLSFGRFRVKRAPQFDDLVASLHTGRCYALEHAKGMLT